MTRQKANILDTVMGTAVAMVANIALAYILYIIARAEYLFENYSYFADSLTAGKLMRMAAGALRFDTSAIVYTNMLYIVMMLFPLWLKERPSYHKTCKWVFVIVNSLCLIVNLCDSVYFPYTLRRTTTSVMREFQNDNNISGVLLTETINHWYLVVLGVVLIYALWKLYVMPRTDGRIYTIAKERMVHAGIYLLMLAAAVPLCIGACRGGLASGIRPITINNANQYVDRPMECALVLNTPFAILRTIGKNVFKVPDYYTDQQQLDKVYTPIHPGATFAGLPPESGDSAAVVSAAAPGNAAPTVAHMKKNIVVIIVESFGREYIGALNKDLEGGKYQGFTPNVDKLVSQSATFRYSYCNGQKSIDGMPSVLSSIPMFVEPFVLTPASMNTYTGIAGLLKDWGYHTAFFHGANRGSMGFMAFANKTGFEQYYGRQDYAADSRFGGDADFDGNWGIWDEPFMQYFCTKMGEMKQPFMTAIFTVSSHHPFVVPEKYKNTFKEEQLPIHKCIRYTDMAIGKFFESARKQPWFENTIFVFTSDHTNQSNHPEYQTDLGRFCSPILIYDPSGNIKPGMRNAVAQQIDIMPTLLNYVGYDKPYLAFGIDLLRTPAEETFAVNYLNGVYQYVKYGHVLQFDGSEVKAVYSLDDRLMRRNLKGHTAVEKTMVGELKAIIQQYMNRMVGDKLMP